MIGKTQENFVAEGYQIYKNRIKHYIPFEDQVIPGLKNTRNLKDYDVKQKEGEQILKQIKDDEVVVLLDERGMLKDSMDFSSFLANQANQGFKQLTFVIGGAYGFAEIVYSRANYKISLSKMTFSHQLIRVIFMEQFYRAMTILNNEPYHK